MQITTNCHHDVAYERLFDDLIKEVFGFSFMPWFDHGLWDEKYESYSIIENGRMISNVCIFKTDMVVNRKPVRAHQFGAVATRKSERGKGYSRALMEYILGKYPDTPAFLSANPGVIDFYPRFGFRQTSLFRPELTVKINNPVSPIMLAPDDDRISKALIERTSHSNIIDSLNTLPVQIFHLLLDYPDRIYYLPQNNVVVVAEQDGDKLFVADVIAPMDISFDDIEKELPFRNVNRVEFGFCPDWLGIIPQWTPMDNKENPFFIRGEWSLPNNYRFSVMSET